jgi:hypothetical protein
MSSKSPAIPDVFAGDYDKQARTGAILPRSLAKPHR